MRRRVLFIALMLAALIPATAMAANASSTFTGRTSQGKKAVIRVSRGSVTRPSKLAFSLHCLHGTLTGTTGPRGRLHRGRLARHDHFNDSGGPGVRVKGKSTLRLAVHGGTASGTYSERDTVVSSRTGAVLDHCSIAISFKAKR